MRTLNKILAVTASVTTWSAIAGAQGCLVTGDDGATASPRWREYLNENRNSAAVSSSQVVVVAPAAFQATDDNGVTCSPRYREFLNEENAQIDAQQTIPEVAEEYSAGYRATGDDGITASPRYRQFLNERENGQSVSY